MEPSVEPSVEPPDPAADPGGSEISRRSRAQPTLVKLEDIGRYGKNWECFPMFSIVFLLLERSGKNGVSGESG